MSHVSKSSIRWMRFTHGGLWWVGISVPLLIAMAKYMTKATKEEWILVHSSRAGSILMHNGEAGWVRGEVIHSRVLCCQCVCVHIYQISDRYNKMTIFWEQKLWWQESVAVGTIHLQSAGEEIHAGWCSARFLLVFSSLSPLLWVSSFKPLLKHPFRHNQCVFSMIVDALWFSFCTPIVDLMNASYNNYSGITEAIWPLLDLPSILAKKHIY